MEQSSGISRFLLCSFFFVSFLLFNCAKRQQREKKSGTGTGGDLNEIYPRLSIAAKENFRIKTKAIMKIEWSHGSAKQRRKKVKHTNSRASDAVEKKYK